MPRTAFGAQPESDDLSTYKRNLYQRLNRLNFEMREPIPSVPATPDETLRNLDRFVSGRAAIGEDLPSTIRNFGAWRSDVQSVIDVRNVVVSLWQDVAPQIAHQEEIIKSVYQNELRSRGIENKSRCSRASGRLGECRRVVRSGREGGGIDAANCWSVRPPNGGLPSRCREECGVWPAVVGCRVDAVRGGAVASRRRGPLELVEAVGEDVRAGRPRRGPRPPMAAVV